MLWLLRPEDSGLFAAGRRTLKTAQNGDNFMQKEKLTKEQLYDKTFACWMGKNIGGTLGGPLEGKYWDITDFDFYTQEFDGQPMENDDLDLQLLNLHTVEQYGVRITARHLAKEWQSHCFFCMDEYGHALNNMRRGLTTPVSGWHNNFFTDCMGSPIRSEIWGCLAAGNPELAAYFAYQDATVDHSGGEGVFGPIRDGMKRMARTTRVLREAPVACAAKTGSPQLADTLPGGGHYVNSVLIGYAPADDPQIAMAVVLEYGGGGSNAAPILRAVLDAVFGV